MNAAQVLRKLRPFTWAVALLLVLFISWRADIWGTSSSPADSAGDSGAGGADVGLTTYKPGDRPEAPALQGSTVEGSAFRLSDLAGHIVVLNVWGSWCGPCRAETPDLVRLARQHEDRGVRFVGIDTRDNLAAARAFVARYDVPYPSVFDEDGRALLPFNHIIPSAAVPSTLVIDPDGKVAARVVGPVTYATLNGLLDDLQGEAR